MSFLLNSTLEDVGSAGTRLIKGNRIVQGVVAVAALGLAYKKFSAVQARSKFLAEVKNQKSGVVHIFCIPRLLPNCPHLGYNITKIEAFCRVHNIPYEMHMGGGYAAQSPTETLPFINLDGQLIGESSFCIDAIAKRFNIKHETDMTPLQQAASVLVRKTIDWSLNQHLMRTTLVDNKEPAIKFLGEKFAPVLGIPKFLIPIGFGQYRKATINRLNTSGLGWLDDVRYQLEFVRDVNAIATLVEEQQQQGNNYLGGDKPLAIDCMLYGLLSSTAAGMAPLCTKNDAGITAMLSNTSLKKYTENFEATYYKDLATISPCGFGTQSFLGEQ